jgi:pimeloyl-ACP methyl ester carboxylesterase
MQIEALDVLPKLLDAISFRRGILVGHSDGASIAAIHAGGTGDHRVRAIALIAPHFFTEDMGIAAIAEIKTAYETTDLRAKLARWHRDVDNAFYGWNGAWLDPKFRTWDISDYLAYIRVPVAVIQGADDQYGTIRQVEIAQEECY